MTPIENTRAAPPATKMCVAKADRQGGEENADCNVFAPKDDEWTAGRRTDGQAAHGRKQRWKRPGEKIEPVAVV